MSSCAARVVLEKGEGGFERGVERGEKKGVEAGIRVVKESLNSYSARLGKGSRHGRASIRVRQSVTR